MTASSSTTTKVPALHHYQGLHSSEPVDPLAEHNACWSSRVKGSRSHRAAPLMRSGGRRTIEHWVENLF